MGKLIETKTNKSSCAYTFVTFLCGLTFVLGLFSVKSLHAKEATTAQAIAQEISEDPTEIVSNIVGAPSEEAFFPPNSLASAEIHNQSYAIRAIELAHATLFAILAINFLAIVLFFTVKFWPKKLSLASRLILIEDKIHLSKDATLVLAKVKGTDYLILLNKGNSNILKAPELITDKSSGSAHSTTESLPTVPLTDDEEIDAAVRSMISDSRTQK